MITESEMHELLDEAPLHMRLDVERELIAEDMKLPVERVHHRTLRFGPGSKHRVWLVIDANGGKETVPRVT